AVQVSLWMTTSQSSFKIFLYDSAGAATNTGYVIPANMPKGSWQTLTIPMTSFAGAGKTIKGIGIRDTSRLTGPQYWVDNLAFLQTEPTVPSMAAASGGAAGDPNADRGPGEPSSDGGRVRSDLYIPGAVYPNEGP